MVRPLLGDIELQQVQKIETEADQVFTQHSIPALEGDFFQGLERRNTWVKLSGVLTGADVQTGLKDLRDKFRAAQPVDFVADIATATKVNQVVIEEMGVRELAGKPARFEYAFTLREYIPAPAPQQEPPPPIPPRLDPVTATLIVEVIVEGEPTFDFSTVIVTVRGTQDDGAALDRTLTNRTNNRWTEATFPPGNYTARAIVSSDPNLPPGSAAAVVQSGQTTPVTITLRREPQRPTNVAKKFVVHFWFDKAFVEPCMRHVLRQVAEYARNHNDEKMLIVGNTDKSGLDNYNLSLGDRRARSIYAYLTSGRDQAGALAEWNLLRRSQDGQLRTVKDNWGTRQYQYMLQTLGFYPGNIDGQHGSLTNKGVQDFQTSKGLPSTGIVNDATWEKLIESYLSLDPQAVPDSQFFRNCGDEPLKWVSCGEQHPRGDTPIDSCAPELAWRPNRRTEILFVRADSLPRPEPIPVTFNLPNTPPVGSDWCVGPKDPDPSGTARRCDFLKQDCSTPPAPDEWCVEPVEPGSITVSGSIKDENGNSLGIIKYVLIAPDGKFMDGERKCGPDRGRPISGKTDADGNFAYTDSSPIGIYTMEVELPAPPQIAHAKTKPAATGRGSVVCKRLDSSDSVFDVIIRSGTPSNFAVNPLITLTSAVVVVKKSYTNPARQLVTLKTDSEFIGTGTFERSNPAIRFFTAATDGTKITFNGTDNVFDGAQLTAGIPLFAEGTTSSTAMDDVTLTLTLSSVDLLVGPPATATMTAVELTLDICDRRSAPGVDPVPLSTADKIDPGRFLEVRNASNTHERALLIVRQANPAAFTGDLELNAIDNKIQIFAEVDEVPAAGQTTLTTPQVIPNGTIPADGIKFWAEGATVSSALRDTGFQLGIKDVEKQGDRVAVTVFSVQIAPITLVGKNQTFDVLITVLPTALPSGTTITLELTTTAGTGAAKFTSTNTTTMTIAQTKTVTIQGVTESSVVDNLRLTAKITGQPHILAQEDFSVVAVAIGAVTGVKTNQTLDIPITITPSPLPAGSSITLDLKTTSGTGEAKFTSTNTKTTTITQTGSVTVQGVTASSVTDNIRLTAKITGQTAILAQEDFTIFNRINIFAKFEVWNLTSKAFEPLPAGIDVDLMDDDPLFNDRIATQKTDVQGRVHFSLSDFSTSGEDKPDLFFLVKPAGRNHAGHTLPQEWSTKGWRATDGSPGLFEDFAGTDLGTEATPLVYRVGVDVHVKLTYLDQRSNTLAIAPPNVSISLTRRGVTKLQLFTDAQAEAHGVVFDLSGSDSLALKVDFAVRADGSINMRAAKVSISAWQAQQFADNQQTSLGTQTAPIALNANSNERNVALFFLKILRELSVFLFHITGGAWTGFEDLTLFRTAISGTAYSWPVGSVNIPSEDHWKRGTLVHEITHQVMWKELDFSSADIAFEALFGELQLTHFESLLANSEQALIEGWPEFTEAIFAGKTPPLSPYIVDPVFKTFDDFDKNRNPQPLGPPPLNRGEQVEGAFANGLWELFRNHVVTSAVAADARIPESVNGDITVTAPWVLQADVRDRFLSIIWNPFRSLRSRSSDPTSTMMLERIRIANPTIWHLLQSDLQRFNLARMRPTITSIVPSSGTASGGTPFTITGANFISPGTEVYFGQGGAKQRAINVVVVNSNTLTGVTPAGSIGAAVVTIETNPPASFLITPLTSPLVLPYNYT
jgi:outer membrane protein OmpA-like peptidoglycan-associated protein